MNEYYFLFVLAFFYLVFASVQDLKSREVANWLSFSLIGFALIYRVFYSYFNNDWMFSLYGLIGFAVFFVLANALYYSKVFAGGDAKLLMGMGLVIPFSNLGEAALNLGGFLFFLFLIGAIYGLVYSLFIVLRSAKRFSKEFKTFWKRYYLLSLLSILVFLLVWFVYDDLVFAIYFGIFILFIVLVYIYLKAVDVCMIVKLKPSELTEGDWIIDDIRFGSNIVKRTVHGLSMEDLVLLRKRGKSVSVKQGIPFVPAFLLAFVFMVYVWVFLGENLIQPLAFLF